MGASEGSGFVEAAAGSHTSYAGRRDRERDREREPRLTHNGLCWNTASTRFAKLCIGHLLLLLQLLPLARQIQHTHKQMEKAVRACLRIAIVLRLPWASLASQSGSSRSNHIIGIICLFSSLTIIFISIAPPFNHLHLHPNELCIYSAGTQIIIKPVFLQSEIKLSLAK